MQTTFGMFKKKKWEGRREWVWGRRGGSRWMGGNMWGVDKGGGG